MSARFAIDTARSAGAIALVRLQGDAEALRRVLEIEPPAIGTHALVRLPALDDAVLARPDATTWLLMPHGGPAVVGAIAAFLRRAGLVEAPSPTAAYPEASDAFEALLMATLARAASPRAVERLLQEPEHRRRHGSPTAADQARSHRLDRLLEPPLVVALGAPNCGKSTLLGALAGRPVAIVSPTAGTTRDPVAAEIEVDGLVVRWTDAAGVGNTDDPVEKEGIALGLALADSAALVVALAEPGGDWPTAAPTSALRVGTKRDLGPPPVGADLSVSAVASAGLDELRAAIRRRLVPDDDLASDRPWDLPSLAGRDSPA